MSINKDNYETFFLDYHEGNLQAEQVAELFLFLEENPHLKAEFEAFEDVKLPEPATTTYPDKALLKRGGVDETNYVWYMVGSIEGTLDIAGQRMLDEFLKKFPAYRSELLLFEKTKLHSDISVVYENKDELKKPVPVFSIKQSWYYMAAAACLLFLLGAFFLNREQDAEPNITERPGSVISPPHDPSYIEKQKMASENKNEKAGGVLTQESNSGDKENSLPLMNDSVKREPVKTVEKQLAGGQLPRNAQLEKSSEPAVDSRGHEEITLMVPVEVRLTAAVQHAGIRQPDKKQQNTYHVLTASTAVPEFPTVGQVIRQYSEEKIIAAIGDRPLSEELMSKRTPGKVKGIKFMGWCLGKVTGKNVDVSTTYNVQGELTSYRISAGSFNFGKTFASR